MANIAQHRVRGSKEQVIDIWKKQKNKQKNSEVIYAIANICLLYVAPVWKYINILPKINTTMHLFEACMYEIY